jgi:hypothetical protein
MLARAELNVPAFTVPVAVRLFVVIEFATLRSCKPVITVMFAKAELTTPAFTVPVAVRFAVLILFDTFRFVSVPTLVMLG